MLKKLAGRLQWERTSHGIRVEIPSLRGAIAGILGPLIGICLPAAWFLYWTRMETAPSSDNQLIVEWIGIGACAGAACALVFWLARILTAKTVLALDPTETKIERRVIGVTWNSRAFATCGISNLKYIPPPSIWGHRPDNDPATSEIQFQADHKTHRFAAGITQPEATALIGRMREVYNFPASSETEPISAAK